MKEPGTLFPVRIICHAYGRTGRCRLKIVREGVPISPKDSSCGELHVFRVRLVVVWLSQGINNNNPNHPSTSDNSHQCPTSFLPSPGVEVRPDSIL